MKVRLHPEAELELYEAAAWYEDRRRLLGEDLIAEIVRCIDAIVDSPDAWPTWPDAPRRTPPIRRALADRFPFAIAYQAYPRAIRVLAFAHTSRRPFYWVDRSDP